ncbi:MAG: uracil-DNA glycosylase family protein [Alphaproteobacteria bacterium]|jgi:uracil-DNA glycosylase
MTDTIETIFRDIRACTHCAADLPMGPRPVVRGTASARVCIIGQAPGVRVHRSGVPWDDPSGKRLRGWLEVDDETFYDEDRFAIIPVGFCYPGTMANGGDYPPRKECAPLWHAPVLNALKNVDLTLLVGSYAQAYYLGKNRKKTMTETVRSWRDYGPDVLVTPHPSWRTTGWQKKNPWFDEEILPELRRKVKALIA